MRIPYIPHIFGNDAITKVSNRIGWVTVGVATSIPWPQEDLWLEYENVEFFLHGAKLEGRYRVAPCISTPSSREDFDNALASLYRFTSVLGYFKGGYVDITGRNWGSHMIRYSTPSDDSVAIVLASNAGFNCNYMPIIEDEKVRKALAFLREGRRLERVHEPYSFLSFFKVIESQFQSKERVQWVERTLALLTEERAVSRIKELTALKIDVNKHLFESGRCAVAHAGIDGIIVDPDIPSDRRRISEDLDIIAALANYFVKVDAKVPDEREVYKSRDRLTPWHSLLPSESLQTLKEGGQLDGIHSWGMLSNSKVTLRLWPDAPISQFQNMTLIPHADGPGWLGFHLMSAKGSFALAFVMDVRNGHMHTQLEDGGLLSGVELDEEDVADYTRYFHSVVGNRKVELSIDGTDPVECDIVIPVNIIGRLPEEAVAEALQKFRAGRFTA